MNDRLDRRVGGLLAALVLLLPLGLGGRAPVAVAGADVVVLGLLALALRERRRRAPAADAPGVGWLAAFAVLALATTLPVPPAALRALAPATADLVATVLPGWPAGDAWSRWRPVALDAWAVRDEMARLAIGLGVFAVLVGWPWRDGAAGRRRVARLLVVTLLAGGVAMALLGLATHVLGNGQVLWITDEPALEGRASGPFVNPNHFATWLEAVLPLGLALLAVTARRAVDGVRRAARAARALGVRPRQAWAQALIAQQQRLLVPLAVLAGLVVGLAAHAASGSRGGTAALFAGLGVTAAGLLAGVVRGPRWLRRALPIAAACGLLVASGGTLALWDASLADGAEATAGADPGLASRLEVMAAGGALVRDHWLVGTGLGTWLHAFRPYQAPPVDGGIWDRAHDDYLELAAETGVAGLLCVLGFVVALAVAARRTAPPEADDGFHPPGFEPSDWRRALDAVGPLRFGLLGGVVALAVHATVDFGLRLPGNLAVAAVLAGLLVLTARPRPGRAGGSVALAVLLLAVLATLAPRAADTVGTLAGADPRDPRAALAAADLRWAEDGDAAGALALVTAALDAAPADREAHELHATVLDAGPASEAALRRALVLDPWSIELRDRLALALWARGDAAGAAAELAESVRRAPALVSHGYLAEDVDDAGGDGATRVLRVLAEGDGLAVRLAALPAPLADAVGRGLAAARDAAPAGAERLAIVDDLATVLEARGRPGDAAAALYAAANGLVDGGPRLARAARGYLAAGDVAGAEAALLAAVVRTPERGELYRQLAVDVYAARDDFATAARVLEAAERHAADLTPVWRATTEVLRRREAAWSARFAGEAVGARAPAPRGAAGARPDAADERLAEVLR